MGGLVVGQSWQSGVRAGSIYPSDEEFLPGSQDL